MTASDREWPSHVRHWMAASADDLPVKAGWSTVASSAFADAQH